MTWQVVFFDEGVKADLEALPVDIYRQLSPDLPADRGKWATHGP